MQAYSKPLSHRNHGRSSSRTKRVPSPPKLLARKSLQADVQPPAKKADDPDDIAELERRVLEAKKVLEVMVKEKLKDKRRSTSSSSGGKRKRDKKRPKKSRRDSSSD